MGKKKEIEKIEDAEYGPAEKRNSEYSDIIPAYRMLIAQKVVDGRKNAGITQEELASLVCVSVRTIGRIEKYGDDVDLDTDGSGDYPWCNYGLLHRIMYILAIDDSQVLVESRELLKN